ncbi:ester cyclase [Natrarchaeobius oligotrophus]|uniref:Ester cyclase n=1 Tax=Natrarchaeobius chitinivorans TaxID=1679083 RepID=A0A3N6N445_NATCH|nr:ester cyclase [Natrarchaeobius chitinivorans]RQH02497.1 ester cyclase [Natrarchaeobius chitinivorans]
MANEEIVRRLVDAWDENDTDELREIYRPDAVDHWGPEGLGSTYSGISEILEAESGFRRAFPDYSMGLLHATGDGEFVSQHWMITGTHEGEFMGIPPTGNEVTYDGMAFHRLENGAIAESWWITNRLRLLRGLDVIASDDELAEMARSDE